MIADTISFSITFVYKRFRFTAKVHRFNFDPVRYLVRIDRQSNLDIEISSIISLIVQNGELTLNNAYVDIDLADIISTAITDHCSLNNIPLT